jgi:hypothetical protein
MNKESRMTTSTAGFLECTTHAHAFQHASGIVVVLFKDLENDIQRELAEEIEKNDWVRHASASQPRILYVHPTDSTDADFLVRVEEFVDDFFGSVEFHEEVAA